MKITEAKVETQYSANICFSEKQIFLTDPEANTKFKEVFQKSLLEAKTHEEHWEYVKAIMKPYVEGELFKQLPDVGYWKKEFKAEFKNVLLTIQILANNNSGL